MLHCHLRGVHICAFTHEIHLSHILTVVNHSNPASQSSKHMATYHSKSNVANIPLKRFTAEGCHMYHVTKSSEKNKSDSSNWPVHVVLSSVWLLFGSVGYLYNEETNTDVSVEKVIMLDWAKSVKSFNVQQCCLILTAGSPKNIFHAQRLGCEVKSLP